MISRAKMKQLYLLRHLQGLKIILKAYHSIYNVYVIILTYSYAV